ncbi:unnamed protein product [Coregonus sp. 'balchen']|nr:unnamed protein product [Coregonus sp. 'balchen']
MDRKIENKSNGTIENEHKETTPLAKEQSRPGKLVMMFLNTVLVVVTDLWAGLLGSAIFRHHFHLLLWFCSCYKPMPASPDGGLNLGQGASVTGQSLLLLHEGESKASCLKSGMLWRGWEVSEDTLLLCLCCLLLAEETAILGPYLALGGPHGACSSCSVSPCWACGCSCCSVCWLTYHSSPPSCWGEL